MKHAHPTLRPGMTALAAALALTSTPLFAQDLAPAPVEPSAPVVAAPAPAVEPAPPAAAAPSAALNIPKISVDLSDAPATSSTEVASPAAKASSAERIAGPEQAAPAPVKQAPVKAAATPPAAPEPMVAMTEVPAPESPLQTPPVATEAPAPMAAAPTPAAPQTAASTMDEALPFAGGVLAALALAGGAFAVVGRRRRYRDDYRTVETDEPRVAAEAERLTLRTPINPQPAATYAAPKPAAGTAGAALPAGFDLSRYGPHVQAAFRGPTPDNPSLSLRTRLKRARFYDQRERMATTRVDSGQAAPQAPAARPTRLPEFVTSRSVNVGSGGFRPAYQG